jgi:hypothetical protein
VTPFDPRLQLVAAQARVKTCHVYHCWQAMRTLGKGFHAGAFAQFAGLEDHHVFAIISALTDHEALPEGRAKVERRASRLPDDFQPPDEWIDWAVDKRRWTPVDARDEAELFTNYWQARPGQQACKLDWFKTWQNWVKTSRRPDGDYQPRPMVADRSHMERTAALYERMGRTNEAEEIRRQLASTANVIPFNRSEEKIAI